MIIEMPTKLKKTYIEYAKYFGVEEALKKAYQMGHIDGRIHTMDTLMAKNKAKDKKHDK